MATKRTKDESRQLFLKELSALTRRYKFSIGGCGCCGSPWLHHDPKIRSGAYEVGDGDDRLVFVRVESRG